MARPRPQYNCMKCPGYCCSYPRIPVTESDVARLAQHFDITPVQARRRFTRKGGEEGEQVLRHQSDPVFDSICRFFDTDQRRCTVYEHRPEACREYPGTTRCGYYDFLASERRRQEDPDLVLTAWVTDLDAT